MQATPATTERRSFSVRLQQALAAAHYAKDSPTVLAREFNFRSGMKPVTVHAARKWIVGEAIPTQDKIRALSEWLGVPMETLRFGVPSIDCGTPPAPRVDSEHVRLIAEVQRLDAHHQAIVREFVRMLFHVNVEVQS